MEWCGGEEYRKKEEGLSTPVSEVEIPNKWSEEDL